LCKQNFHFLHFGHIFSQNWAKKVFSLQQARQFLAKNSGVIFKQAVRRIGISFFGDAYHLISPPALAEKVGLIAAAEQESS
jgi:hypothetical protein